MFVSDSQICNVSKLFVVFFLHIAHFSTELHQHLLSEDHVCGRPFGSQAERSGQDTLETLGSYFPAGQCLDLSSLFVLAF